MQYDLLLTQNTHSSGVEFSEKYVNIAKGGLVSADTNQVPTVLAAGTNGYMLVRDDAETTGLKWIAISAGHTQNTDSGTTSNTFTIDSDGTIGKIILDADNAGGNYSTTIQNTTQAGSIVLTLPAVTGTLATEAYASGLFASNDAMIFKGTIGTGGTHTIAAFNALTTYNTGWTYRVVEAGTIRSIVCQIGDLVMIIADRSGSGNVDADFTVAQTNIDGAVTGPASTTDNYVALFSGTTGKVIKAGTGALGTAAYTASTAYATSAQGSTADGAIPKSTLTEQGDILYASAASTPAALAHGNAGQVLQSGGNAANPSWLTLGTMAAATATDYVTKALFDANTILAATTDNTPAALTIAASTIVGRKASGDISAMSAAETMNVLWQSAPATKTSTGTLGMIAKDDNFMYICTATNVWKRGAIATNW